jgi:hypothetical protein
MERTAVVESEIHLDRTLGHGAAQPGGVPHEVGKVGSLAAEVISERIASHLIDDFACIALEVCKQELGVEVEH